MGSQVLAVEGLSKGYISGDQRVPVLADLSLSVCSGESLAVVGRSGSGKSTLLNLLCGLQAPDEGRIAVAGESFDNVAAAGADIRWSNSAGAPSVWCSRTLT